MSPFGDSTLPTKTGLPPDGREAPLPLGAWVVAARVTEYDAGGRPINWERVVGRVVHVLGVATRGEGNSFHYWYVIEGAGGSRLIAERNILAHSTPEDVPGEP